MYSLTIALAQSPVTWTLLFKTKETAFEAWGKRIGSETLDLEDDFGQSACLQRHLIGGMLLENLDESKLAHVARTLHVEHVKIAANKAAAADPALNARLVTPGGPAIFQPGMGNGRG